MAKTPDYNDPVVKYLLAQSAEDGCETEVMGFDIDIYHNKPGSTGFKDVEYIEVNGERFDSTDSAKNHVAKALQEIGAPQDFGKRRKFVIHKTLAYRKKKKRSGLSRKRRRSPQVYRMQLDFIFDEWDDVNGQTHSELDAILVNGQAFHTTEEALEYIHSTLEGQSEEDSSKSDENNSETIEE